MSIKGIPEGWELVRIGKLRTGGYRTSCSGVPLEWTEDHESVNANYVISPFGEEVTS